VDAARPDASVADVRAPRLLVVDDEESIRQALARFFGRRGWAVDEAGDGRAAFARLLDAEASGAPYDLVLSDVRMPDVSGVALHDWIARTRPTLLERVVFATGDDASAESADFIRRTRCRVLAKPFDADTLAALARDAGTAVPRDDGGHVDDDAALAAASAAPAIVTMPANARADRPPAHGPA
jgi:DNA-binding NtrC family response regulator